MTEEYLPIITYLGKGVFSKVSNEGFCTTWCNCSIKYRKIPYTLEEYENKQMFADILTGCDR